MFINISNHPSEKWSPRQQAEALRYGEILDLGFPSVDPEASAEDVRVLAEQYFQKVQHFESPVVMVQGEFVFTWHLVNLLVGSGIRTVAACSRRISHEEIADDGTIRKMSVFEFVQFREYSSGTI